jgi:hypothetical protein
MVLKKALKRKDMSSRIAAASELIFRQEMIDAKAVGEKMNGVRMLGG